MKSKNFVRTIPLWGGHGFPLGEKGAPLGMLKWSASINGRRMRSSPQTQDELSVTGGLAGNRASTRENFLLLRRWWAMAKQLWCGHRQGWEGNKPGKEPGNFYLLSGTTTQAIIAGSKTSVLEIYFKALCLFFSFFFFFCFLGLNPWRMKVPSLGVESEL